MVKDSDDDKDSDTVLMIIMVIVLVGLVKEVMFVVVSDGEDSNKGWWR